MLPEEDEQTRLLRGRVHSIQSGVGGIGILCRLGFQTTPSVARHLAPSFPVDRRMRPGTWVRFGSVRFVSSLESRESANFKGYGTFDKNARESGRRYCTVIEVSLTLLTYPLTVRVGSRSRAAAEVHFGGQILAVNLESTGQNLHEVRCSEVFEVVGMCSTGV